MPPTWKKKSVQFSNNTNGTTKGLQPSKTRKLGLNKIRINQAYRGILNTIRPTVKMEVNLQLPRDASQTEKAILNAYETWKYGYYALTQLYSNNIGLQNSLQEKLWSKFVKDAAYAALQDASTKDDLIREFAKPIYYHISEQYLKSIINYAEAQLKTSRRYNRYATAPLPCNEGVNWNAPLENWNAPPVPPLPTNYATK